MDRHVRRARKRFAKKVIHGLFVARLRSAVVVAVLRCRTASRLVKTALILLAMALALTACGRFTVMPPPEGEPVVLKPAELATTWTDADGGTLTLKPDGTFIADKVCVAVGWYDSLAWSGTGTWEQGSNKKQSFVGVTFDADHPEVRGRVPDAYAALRQGKVLKLWAAIGDPDNDYPNCVLTSPAS